MKNIVILGSTGSIGTQALEVIENMPEMNVLALTANSSFELLSQQIDKFKPQYAVLADKNAAQKLEQKNDLIQTELLTGLDSLSNMAALKQADIVLNALVGAAGLKPSLACLQADNRLALANKESMVIGGELINQNLDEFEQTILPVDSEHNAVFQLLRGNENKEIDKIYLTASGGPFLDLATEELEQVTVQEALDHPNWDMGAKITIDSATMMNKGLEVIEAHFLFKQPFDKIDVVIHPESIIHSMVEFVDHSIHAELGAADMRLPIQHALTYPNTKQAVGDRLDLFEVASLNFKKPDFKKFPALELAYFAGRKGGTMPAVLNAANEIAVQAFLDEKISYTDIFKIIEKLVTKHNKIDQPDIDDIIEVDQWTRKKTKEVIY